MEGWIGVAAVLFVNAIGWVLIIRRNGKKDAYYQGLMRGEIKSMGDKVDGLPCQADTGYLESRGAIKQHMKDTDSRMQKLEGKVFGGYKPSGL